MLIEGTIGFLKGMEKFDAGKGFRFSTYVVHWIKQFTTRPTACAHPLVEPTLQQDSPSCIVKFAQLIVTGELERGSRLLDGGSLTKRTLYAEELKRHYREHALAARRGTVGEAQVVS